MWQYQWGRDTFSIVDRVIGRNANFAIFQKRSDWETRQVPIYELCANYFAAGIDFFDLTRALAFAFGLSAIERLSTAFERLEFGSARGVDNGSVWGRSTCTITQ